MTATDRKLATQSIRAVTKMATVSPQEAGLLVEMLVSGSLNVATIERVLATYETRQVWQAGHGDVPLKLRRAIRLLQKDAG